MSPNDVGAPRIEFLPMSIFILSDERICPDGTCLSNPLKLAAEDVKSRTRARRPELHRQQQQQQQQH